MEAFEMGMDEVEDLLGKGFSSHTMNVLEIEVEEAESMVGSGRKRTNLNNRSKSAGAQDMLRAIVLRGNFLTKVLVVAGLALVALFYMAALGSQDDSNDSIAKPMPMAPGPTSAITPVAPVAPPTNPPVNPPTNPPVNPPTDPPVNPSTDPQDAPKKGIKDGNNLYSKYATLAPLIDHPLPDDDTVEKISEKWGKWMFWDGDEDYRPTDDYCADYPNRDIPGDEFPEDAWQADAVFVNHYLDAADKLIGRAMDAIFEEYGYGKASSPEALVERMEMFHWSKEDLSQSEDPPEKYKKKGTRGNGGWTTERSFDGLVRRLLHAMMTSDTFTVVMGGHSAAVGQGNHFRQSYMMQFHKIMSPIFARLGVKLITRNMAQGGMGTIQAGMGSGSIYGDDVDLLLWDSGMTEGKMQEHIDIFLRQGLLGGRRVPVLWGGGGNFQLLRTLHEHADADVGEWGSAMDKIIEVENQEQAKTIPWAARYMKCKDDAQSLCDAEPRFCAHCWIDRDDGIKPDAEQLDKPKGQVKWHPGWRSHQLTGRNIAFGVLEALQAAVSLWVAGVTGGPPLDDEHWHVTEYYDNIRTKVTNLDKDVGDCYSIEGSLPPRMCNTPMKARTQYTPRADFHQSSLTSIIKPTSDGYVPKNEKTLLYNGPDAHNECFDIPEGEVDVFDIVASRRHLESVVEPQFVKSFGSSRPPYSVATNRSLETGIIPGKGWEVWGEPAGYCDGTYNAVCRVETDNECVLYGHHDERGAIVGNEYSGWLVMTLDDLKEGIIVLKLHTWHDDSENEKTKGWNSVNNERRRRLGDSRYTDEIDGSKQYVELDETGERELMRSYETPELPETFIFEYAINGKVTTLSKEQFLEQKKQLQRVVETLTLLDDPDFTSESKAVEIAVRMRGCGRQCTFGVSHVYWA